MELSGFIEAVIIERALASYFIADYEKKLRLWIWRLIENVRTMKIIMVIILIMATQSTVALGLMIIASTAFASQPRNAHLCYAVMNLLMALSMLIEALMGGVALGEWRRMLRRNPRLQSFLYYCFSVSPQLNSIPERHNTNSIQEHFSQLKQAWEKGRV
ncbi:hypothetical protein TELCIR_06897 [Teladorsagia circumcincta]|uniref:Uncharacterized protein n=1 Tax=Teladorsagia circumcincta TaxID=45464 RepID=A0A2G9UM32_TELCI|nr:hypothetical protein TELCIR_06897 [Teladorsagia circumcincta]